MSKRVFDIALCIIFVFALFIPMLLIGIVVLISSRGPALYWSQRIGYKNQIFMMPKFRSMEIDTPELATDALNDPQKFITPFGQFLRKNSLDELPQLWCIARGQMSFVGPRPALYNQTDLINLRTYHGIENLIPGLTGWAQINGRDNISLIDKVMLEKEYLNKKSLLFDSYILLMTFLRVLSKSNISH